MCIPHEEQGTRERVVNAARKFRDAAIALSTAWEEHEADGWEVQLLDDYPFADSFDEVVLGICGWLNNEALSKVQ